MSFSLTPDQIRGRTKTVTRRAGWRHLRVGEEFRAVVKCMGLKPGEKIQPLAVLRAVDIRREPLNLMGAADCIAEGFPDMTPAEFVTMFCASHKGVKPESLVTRIEFEYQESAHE